MTSAHRSSEAGRRDDPDYCPFYGVELTDPGAGFIDHIDDAPDCEEQFRDWVDAIRDDMGGDWSG